jgi:hypothetical protein
LNRSFREGIDSSQYIVLPISKLDLIPSPLEFEYQYYLAPEDSKLIIDDLSTLLVGTLESNHVCSSMSLPDRLLSRSLGGYGERLQEARAFSTDTFGSKGVGQYQDDLVQSGESMSTHHIFHKHTVSK